jgi:integrase/recombinase XerD
VRAYLDHLAVERGLAANTIVAYQRDLSRYARHLAARGMALGEVTQVDVTGFLRALREDPDAPLSASSAARAVSAVRGLHRFTAREGLTPDDAALEVTSPTLPRRLPRALQVGEVLRLLDTARIGEHPVALRDIAVLEFLYGTGARVSEAVGLAVDDLDLDARTVLLHGKGGRTRVVPIGGFATEALQAYLRRARPALLSHARSSASAQLFRNARGGALTRQGAWLILRTAAARAGLAQNLSPHVLRHSFATHLLDGGADVRVVQELLGHASVTTTQIYTLVTVDKLREVYAVSHPRARG